MPGVVEQDFNPSTREEKAGRSLWIGGQSDLQREIQASQIILLKAYLRSYSPDSTALWPKKKMLLLIQLSSLSCINFGKNAGEQSMVAHASNSRIREADMTT